jgi:hypothetical protein
LLQTEASQLLKLDRTYTRRTWTTYTQFVHYLLLPARLVQTTVQLPPDTLTQRILVATVRAIATTYAIALMHHDSNGATLAAAATDDIATLRILHGLATRYGRIDMSPILKPLLKRTKTLDTR